MISIENDILCYKAISATDKVCDEFDVCDYPKPNIFS